jgi:CheY-like chemotaxis protein
MNKRLLIVDDSETERAALRQILAAEPTWELTEAQDGQQALDLLVDGFRPHLCLVDLKMPVMGGLEFLQRVRREPTLRHLKVTVTSASRDRTMVIELAKLGIEGYLLKPYDAERTLAILRPVIAAMVDPADAPQAARAAPTRKALVVDDDPVARTFLRDAIAQEGGWEIMEAADGVAALEQLHGGLRPDLCFLDLQMAGMDGTHFLMEIRADPALRNLRVAVTSGVKDREKIRVLAQLQVSAYLLKPLDLAKVRAALQTLK